MTWTAPEPPPIPEGPDTGELRPILQGYLDAMRRTVLNLCAGLTAEQLATASVPPSDLTLLGLVRHLRKVERYWFRIGIAGEDVPPLYPAKDEDFHETSDAAAALQDLQDEWRACDAAVAGLGLDTEMDHRGSPCSLGLVYVHLVHEYARHVGHGDLVRQTLDGATGR